MGMAMGAGALVVSGTEAQERRRSERLQTIFHVVVIHSVDDVGLCCLRNISDTGLMVETGLDVKMGDLVAIDLFENMVLQGTVMWRDGDRVGLQFPHPIDSAEALKLKLDSCASLRRKLPRLPIDHPAVLYSEAGTFGVRVQDISQKGAKIRHSTSFRAGLPVKICLAPGKENSGVIRWCEQGMAGIHLLDPIRFQDLKSVKGF